MRGGEGRRRRTWKRFQTNPKMLSFLLPYLTYLMVPHEVMQVLGYTEKSVQYMNPSIYPPAHCKSEPVLAANDEKLVEAGGCKEKRTSRVAGLDRRTTSLIISFSLSLNHLSFSLQRVVTERRIRPLMNSKEVESGLIKFSSLYMLRKQRRIAVKAEHV